jgi:hypothetical protein
MKKQNQAPENPPEPTPHITPEMLEETLKLLEAEGMVYYAEGGAYIPTESGWKLLMEVEKTKEEIVAYGHSKIAATNDAMIIITKKSVLGKNPDAVIAVRSNKACKDLSPKFKHALKSSRKVEITIEVDGVKDSLTAFGSPAVKLTSSEEIVIRRDDVIDGRTLAIMASKSANELKQDLIEKLRNPNAEVKITLEIKP